MADKNVALFNLILISKNKTAFLTNVFVSLLFRSVKPKRMRGCRAQTHTAAEKYIVC